MNEAKVSYQLADLTLKELINLNYELGRQVDKIRADRVYLMKKIKERIANGEREDTPAAGDAVVPGVVISSSAQ